MKNAAKEHRNAFIVSIPYMNINEGVRFIILFKNYHDVSKHLKNNQTTVLSIAYFMGVLLLLNTFFIYISMVFV